jgi:XTP/dITP diphosphohydrolase
VSLEWLVWCDMVFRLTSRVVFFATNNINKFNEARRVLGEFNIAVGMLRAKSFEIQSDSLEEVAKASVINAFHRCNLPIIVEDAGLFVDSLKGFPGPYAAYVYGTISNCGLLRLMENVRNRRGRFESVIAYLSEEIKEPVCFGGTVLGKIALNERRKGSEAGFGFDPLFIPSGSRKTFAEMGVEEKNRSSHRANAFRKFARWYKASA